MTEASGLGVRFVGNFSKSHLRCFWYGWKFLGGEWHFNWNDNLIVSNPHSSRSFHSKSFNGHRPMLRNVAQESADILGSPDIPPQHGLEFGLFIFIGNSWTYGIDPSFNPMDSSISKAKLWLNTLGYLLQFVTTVFLHTNTSVNQSSPKRQKTFAILI